MNYEFTLEYYRTDGSFLAAVPIEPDFEPAFEWTVFEAVRAGRLPAVDRRPCGAIEPLWLDEGARPYLTGFRAVVAAPEGDVQAEFPTAYLRSIAQRESANLIERGLLQIGDTFRYLVSARPVAAAAPTFAFVLEEAPAPLPIRTDSLARWQREAQAQGEGEDGDLPVFVTGAVLDEIRALAEAAKTVEVGGVLLGSLRRDQHGGELFLTITGHVRAEHTVAEATRLQFTPDTWAAFEATIVRRGAPVVRAGWEHLHPDFCGIRGCPAERRLQCKQSSDFFSPEDVHLHRVCFSRAYQVALLVSDKLERGLTVSMYGWRRGVVARRAFFTVAGNGPHPAGDLPTEDPENP